MPCGAEQRRWAGDRPDHTRPTGRLRHQIKRAALPEHAQRHLLRLDVDRAARFVDERIVKEERDTLLARRKLHFQDQRLHLIGVRGGLGE